MIDKMGKIKKFAILIIIAIFVLVFFVCSYNLAKIFLDFEETKIETTRLIEDVIKISKKSEENKILVDWKKLENINKDIIGWIKINNTKIDYPIIQDKNLYYINHTYEKKYNINGSIFTITNNPFKSKETIIYGHNNQNGLMFSGIENYMDEEFFYNNRTFKIYTKSDTYDAKIFSIYSIGVNEETNNTKNLNFNDCVKYYKTQSKFKVEIEDMPQNIIKLSTCSYLNNKSRPTNQRYYLVASLTKI